MSKHPDLAASFQAAILRELESKLKWTSVGVYKGDWKADIQRAREQIDAAEKAMQAIDEVLA